MSVTLATRPISRKIDEPRPVVGNRIRDVGNWALLLTAIIYAVSQIQVWALDLGWDETIYFSQVSKAAPAAFFSAPRARGITWLAEPLALFTSSVPALRIYLTVLSGLALYLAFRVWFKVLPSSAVVIAAIFFASLWITRFYGAELMPNLWVAFGAVAAVGGFMRLVANRWDWLGLIALPVGLAVAALMRPSDAAWVSASLLLITLLVPAWRGQLRVYLLIVVGSVLGAAPWVIEAYQRWGGVPQRLDRASVIQGGLGWHGSALFQHWQTINGPLLCRPCLPAATPPLDTIWLPLIPVAVLFAALVARPIGGRAKVLVPAVVGLAIGIPYLLLVNYSAPRFLLPAFALLSLPVGVILRRLLLAVLDGKHFRLVLLVLVGVVLALQVVGQQMILTQRAASGVEGSKGYLAVANDLHQFGVQAPCVINGAQSPPVAYYTGCSSRNVGGHDGSISLPQLRALALTQTVVLLRPALNPPPHYARHWAAYPLSATAHGGLPWVAYVSQPNQNGIVQ